MLHRFGAALLALVLAACSLSAIQPARPPIIAVTGGTIVDPDNAGPPVAGTILIRGEHILAVGSRVRVPRGATIVRADGKFILPGLWDMHAHLAALERPGHAPERYVGYGVLGVRDMGGDVATLFALRRDIAEGRRTGPDIYMAGPTLNGKQSADFHRAVTTAAEARAAVRELHSTGVDFIKIHRATTREAFFAIAAETRGLGMTFSGHVPLAIDWMTASSAGMRTIEHIQTLIENEMRKGGDPRAAVEQALARVETSRGSEIFAALAGNGTYFTPTLVGYEASWAKDAPWRDVADRARTAG